MADQPPTTDLLPCPFCRKSSVLIDQFGGKRPFAASCENDECMAIGPEGETREQAAQKWNGAVR